MYENDSKLQRNMSEKINFNHKSTLSQDRSLYNDDSSSQRKKEQEKYLKKSI